MKLGLTRKNVFISSIDGPLMFATDERFIEFGDAIN